MSLKQSLIVEAFLVGGAATWNKRPGLKYIEVVAIGGGCSGQGGLSVATAITAAQGQSGGAGGAIAFWMFPASQLGNSEAISVGAGGASAAGGTAPSKNAGGPSKFGSWLIAQGGQTAPALNSRGMGNPFTTPSQRPGFGGSAASNGAVGAINYIGGASGGAGGGITVTTGALIAPFVGGAVGDGLSTTESGYGGVLAGGALAAPGPASNGSPGGSLGSRSTFGGSGGGGGAAWTTIGSNAGNGGDGGFPGGGGGGGGAAVTGTNLTGNGGKGGDGIIIVRNYF
jgi:hypothetical protein